MKNTLSVMLSSFRSDSEEEGELAIPQETDPKNFRPDKQLNQNQLYKFLEYYTQNTPGEFKYSKTQLNKINSILHNHFHYLSKDMKLFKLYKSIITIVTQDMHEWIEKDYHCGDVIIEILKEVQLRRDNPWYQKLLTKLRLDDIISKQLEKSEQRRRKAEDDRLQQKRARNWEKKQKKGKTRVDPFDSVPLPAKRHEPCSSSAPPSTKQDHLAQDNRAEMVNFYCEDLLSCLPKLDFLDSLPDTFIPTEVPQTNLEVDEWFASPEDFLVLKSENFPETRLNPSSLDPRIEVHLKCRGFDFVLDNPMVSSRLEKFKIIVNIKCLVYVIELSQVLNIKIQIPKETMRVYYNNKEFLVCFRPFWKEFIDICKKCSDLVIFSIFPEEIGKSIIPNCNFITSKCVEVDKELLIVFDNEKIGWKQEFLVPLLYFDPFLKEEKIIVNKEICNLRDKDIINFCNLEAEKQLDGLGKFIVNVYSSFLENSFKFTAICEFKKQLVTIFNGLSFSPKFYESAVGSGGYTAQKLEVYKLMAEEMGGQVESAGRYAIVENKSAEDEVSGKWIMSCYLNFKYLPHF